MELALHRLNHVWDRDRVSINNVCPGIKQLPLLDTIATSATEQVEKLINSAPCCMSITCFETSHGTRLVNSSPLHSLLG